MARRPDATDRGSSDWIPRAPTDGPAPRAPGAGAGVARRLARAAGLQGPVPRPRRADQFRLRGGSADDPPAAPGANRGSRGPPANDASSGARGDATTDP